VLRFNRHQDLEKVRTKRERTRGGASATRDDFRAAVVLLQDTQKAGELGPLQNIFYPFDDGPPGLRPLHSGKGLEFEIKLRVRRCRALMPLA